jgi:hypothetical protein
MPLAREKVTVCTLWSRETGGMTLREVVGLLGGGTVVSRLLGLKSHVLWDYMTGHRELTSDKVLVLSRALSERAERTLTAARTIDRLHALALEREARKITASRERYYARFGRYPVPARGNKTP